MNLGGLDDKQFERLEEARRRKKYGHLMSWKELFVYMTQIATPTQFKEIAEWAQKKNAGLPVYLPLMSNVNKKIGGEEE